MINGHTQGVEYGYSRVAAPGRRHTYEMAMSALKSEGIDDSSIFIDSVEQLENGCPKLERLMRLLERGDSLTAPRLSVFGMTVNEVLRRVVELIERGVVLTIQSGVGRDSATFLNNLTKAIEEISLECNDFRAVVPQTVLGDGPMKVGRRRALSKGDVEFALRKIQAGNITMSDISLDLGVSRSTLYRYVGPQGQLRQAGITVMNGSGNEQGVIE